MTEVGVSEQMPSKDADTVIKDGSAATGAVKLSAAEKEHLNEMILRNLKRTREMFNLPYRGKPLVDNQAQRSRIAVKNGAASSEFQLDDPSFHMVLKQLKEYEAVKDIQVAGSSKEGDQKSKGGERREKASSISRIADEITEKHKSDASTSGNMGLVKYEGGNKNALAVVSDKNRKRAPTSAEIIKKLPSRWPKPVWHAPWKLYRVISGHLGWVRSIAFEPGNEWFATGSADRTIKIWDTASGQLKLTLTGHIEQIRALAVSDRHPYMFSCGDDQSVKCWDLEYNKVIRSYHGHLSGVYSMALHPDLDILMTGGRDSVCRVWDIRTKSQIFCLTGHDNTVCSILTQNTDPQVVTGSHDSTIRLWDLAAGKTMSTLTHHKKSVRAMAMHPKEFTFVSASVDNIKKYKLPEGQFLHNMTRQQKTIVNTMAVNEDNVLVTGGDNGSLWFWDWASGYSYQQYQTIVQPGSLDSEAGIYACTFDITGSRLVTCEADKTIKMYKEDLEATPETHPINFKPPTELRRF